MHIDTDVDNAVHREPGAAMQASRDDQSNSVLNSLDTQRADLVGDWMKSRLPEHENLPSQSVSWWDPGLATVSAAQYRLSLENLARAQ